MADSQDREFIREQIIEKTAGRKHRVKKIVCRILAAMAFGLIAAVTFFLCLKWFGISLPTSSEEKPGPSFVIQRDDEEWEENPKENETAEEDQTASFPETGAFEEGNPIEEGTLSKEEQEAWMEEIAKSIFLTEWKKQDSYLAEGWYRLAGSVIKSVNKGLVTITCTLKEKDWFATPIVGSDSCSGGIFCLTEAEALILADYDSVKDAEALAVTFTDGTMIEARIKKTDQITGLAVISVSRAAIPESTWNKICELSLGNSYQLYAGQPVIALGSPMGYPGSVLTGMISLIQRNTVGTDTAFQLVYSDLAATREGNGFLFNTEGELVAILTKRFGDQETGLPVAIGISGLKGVIQSLSSGIDVAYLGIQGQNATAAIAEAYQIPSGIYINKVVVDSPAYEAGLKAGDILVSAENGEADLTTMLKLQNFLENYSTGDVVILKVYRAAQEEYVEMKFTVTLGSR